MGKSNYNQIYNEALQEATMKFLRLDDNESLSKYDVF